MALVIGVGATPARAQIAVVVHPTNPVAGLTADQLRRLYLGTTTRFPGGAPVALVEHGPVREAFYRSLLGMSGPAVSRHWMRVIFAGEGAAPPRLVAAATDLLEFVSAHPDAIAFVEMAALDRSVKVLTIDGKRPGERGYPLPAGGANR